MVYLNLPNDEEEAQEFYSQLGRCIALWAAVESFLLFLFRACIENADIEVVAASFYAVENFRSKLGMVDSAVTLALKGSPLLQEWSKKGGLHSKIISSSSKRNNLAHWVVYHLAPVKKPPTIYMRPNLLKPSKDVFLLTKPSGGYYVTDLKVIHANFLQLAEEIRDFTDRARGPIKQILKLSERERRRMTTRALRNLKRAERQVLHESLQE